MREAGDGLRGCSWPGPGLLTLDILTIHTRRYITPASVSNVTLPQKVSPDYYHAYQIIRISQKSILFPIYQLLRKPNNTEDILKGRTEQDICMAVIKIFKQRTTSLGIDRVKPWSLVRIDLGSGQRDPDIRSGLDNRQTFEYKSTRKDGVVTWRIIDYRSIDSRTIPFPLSH